MKNSKPKSNNTIPGTECTLLTMKKAVARRILLCGPTEYRLPAEQRYILKKTRIRDTLGTLSEKIFCNGILACQQRDVNMPAMTFSKWSPNGNTTLFFPAGTLTCAQQAHIASQALQADMLGGEQAGFLDMANKSLRMAGGEFCVNACRAFGALLAFEAASAQLGDVPKEAAQTSSETEERHDTIRVSGWQTPVRLRTRGSCPHWQVEAVLRLPSLPPPQQLEPDVFLLRLPGICHVLIEIPDLPTEDYCRATAAQLRTRHTLNHESAVGVIWWRKTPRLEMRPLIHVPAINATYLENACGSGALALALLLAHNSGQQNFSILQPGKTTLDVSLSSSNNEHFAAVDGPVSLLAKGRVWFDIPNIPGSESLSATEQEKALFTP